jgi:hypothetical protein
MPPAEAAVREKAVTTSRDALGAATFERVIEEGRTLTRDAAVELGLEAGEAREPQHSPAFGGPTPLP